MRQERQVKIIDTVTAGNEAAFSVILLYFVLLALTGILEAAREGLLTVFGQKITHALRSSLMDKFVSLTADSVNKQEPGTLVSRFVGDVDMVENLFTSGIISMFADVCKIISILVVIWFQNRGLTLVLLVLLPFLFWFTRHVQKNMLAAWWDFLMTKRKNARPAQPLPLVKTDLATLPLGQDVMVWLGHSSWYLQLAGKRILIDPVFSDYAAPFSFINKAFPGDYPWRAEGMPEMRTLIY